MSVIGINVGLKSLLASKAALEVIGHNLANANTPGYSRQNLDISSSRSLVLNGLAIGNGVDADVVRRTTDALISKRLILQGSTLSRLTERYQGLSDVEAFFGEPGEQGLSSLMSSFFDRVSGLSADPTDRVQRTGVLEAANDIAAQFHNLAQGLGRPASRPSGPRSRPGRRAPSARRPGGGT
jgi:flagellar hook-associated protein 1 FlgK